MRFCEFLVQYIHYEHIVDIAELRDYKGNTLQYLLKWFDSECRDELVMM